MKIPAAFKANARLHRMAAPLARATRASAGIKNRDRSAALRFRMRAASLLALGLAMLFAQTGGYAQAPVPLPNPLPYSTGYLVTGDYVVGSVDIIEVSNSPATATIHIGGVPQNADILAAFLYWETIAPTSVTAPQIADSVKFRGQPIKSVRVKSVGKQLTGPTGACLAGATVPLTMTMFRADVLRLLPRQFDKDGKPTGKLLVNDTDLTSDGLHTVTLPEATGNNVPKSAGASLVLVYRDLNPLVPLRKIVVHDGIYIEEQGATTTQTIGGFYQSANQTAKITHIVGSGANNTSDQLSFQGTGNPLIVPNPFPATSKVSDRSWAAVTFNVGSKMPGTGVNGAYGETVTSKVTHTKKSPYDCLAWAGTWFSTTVLDAEDDGIPDRLERSGNGVVQPVLDPNGVQHDNFYAMGARPENKDIFIEINALETGGATYGSSAAPYDLAAGVNSVTAPAHNHMPPSEVLTSMGKAYGDKGIKAHFDVGATYHALGADYGASVGVGDEYLVPSNLAKGGELDPETACDPAESTCHFPDYPGTIGWGFSFLKHMFGTDRDPTGGTPRFDKIRDGLFHYTVYAHFRGKPRSLPCLDAFESPTLPESDGQCAVEGNDGFQSENYHVPTSASGAGDLPGSKTLVTLGRWENFVGAPITRAGTSLHELGHNLGLWHGGAPAQLVNNGGLVKLVEENCKPNYLSVMSYLYQVRGLKDASNIPRIALSDAVHAPLNELALTDMSILGEGGGSLPYRPAWYAPAGVPGTLVDLLSLPAATKLCNGQPSQPGVSMARVDAQTLSDLIDWATDGFVAGEAATGQDINLDDIVNTLLTGFNDWANIRLDQVGGGHVMGGAISNGGEDFGGEDFGGEDFGGEDFGGEDFGGEDFGGEDFGGEDFGGEDFGGVDLDASEFGSSDFGGEDFGGDDGELTHEDAIAQSGGTGSPPEQVNACVLGGNLPGPGYPRSVNGNLVGSPACEPGASSPLHRTRLTWNAPTLLPDPAMPVELYHVYRVTGGTVTPASEPVEVGTTTGTSFVDNEELPDGQQFTYFVHADFSDTTTSAPSDFATITARNDAPAAIADARSTNEDTPLTGILPVLFNDSDPDSATLTPSLIAGTTNGTLAFNGDGTFTYAPSANFYGTDTFTYQLVAATWPGPPPQPMSADSAVVTVTITVNPVNDAPSFTKGADQTVLEEASAQTVAGWATNLSAGPANETDGLCGLLGATVCSQTVSFLASNDNMALFSVQPAVGSNGTLTYTPAPNANGTATVMVTAQDTGGVLNSGIDTSAPQTFVITVTPVNDQPTVTNQSLSTSEDTDLLLTLTGSDIETDGSDLTINVTVPPQYGQVSISTLTYTPDPGYNGPDSFEFTVTDRGDPDNCVGGPSSCSAALESTAATVSITVTPVNDAPAGADTSVTTVQNTGKVFEAIDFGFTDPDDNPANNFSAVKITTPPAAGTLILANAPLGGGELVTVVDINAGKLKFSPALDGIGAPYASFTFQVQDDGGTATLGDVDLDPTPNTMTINVTLPWVLTTALNCAAGESPEVTADGNSVTMGIVRGDTDLNSCIHGASAVLPPLTAGNTRFAVTFRYKLFSWDAYNAPGTTAGSGYWDSFSVSLSTQPYADLALTDPLPSGGDLIGWFLWGGTDYSDGVLECLPNPLAGTCSATIPTGEMTVHINGNPDAGGNTYLNVVLDTKTLPEGNHAHASYGTIEILNVVQEPPTP